MIEIWVESIDSGNVRCLPLEEYQIDAEPGAQMIEVEMNEELTLRMPKETAEDLYNSLMVHFAGIE